MQPELLTLAKQDKKFAAWLDHWLDWRLKKARPEQVCVLEENPKLNGQVWCAGRGFGKTRLGAEETTAFAMMRPKSYQRIIAPTFAGGRDVCFPANTLVSTSCGDVAISNIKVGDLVWTRDGLKKVLAAKQTGIDDVYTIQHKHGSLSGTKDHPVWEVRSQSFKSLDTIVEGDILLFQQQEGTWADREDLTKTQNTLNLMGRVLRDTQTIKTLHEEIISTGIGVKKIWPSIVRCGFSIMGKLKRSITSIIKTGTRLITGLKISSVSMRATTTKNIEKNMLFGSIVHKTKSILKRFAPLQWLGTNLKKAALGIENIGKNQKRKFLNLKNILVNCVGKNSQAKGQMAFNTVPICAASNHLIKNVEMEPAPVVLVTNIKNAISAKKCSGGMSIKAVQPTARLSAVTAPATLALVSVTVFNLQVEDCPEYFADGVLVYNCVEGDSGILNSVPSDCIEKWNRSMGEVQFYNGSSIKIFSAEEPDRLRGANSQRDWMEELSSWGGGAGVNAAKVQRETWSMAMLGLRLPPRATFIVTTTPKPSALMKELLNRKDIHVSRGSTYDNLPNLSENFRNEILRYEGTMLGRQEIYAELVDMSEQGIFKKDWFRLWPADKPLPHFEYVVLSYDTGFKDTSKSAFSACTTWGVFRDQREGSSESHVLLIDCWREKIPYPDLRERALKNWRTWYGAADPELERHYVMSGRQIKGRQPDIMVVEDKGSGQSLIQDMRNEGINCWAYNPQKAGKEERAHIVSPLVKQGKVWIPESTRNRGHCMTWCEEWLDEMIMFPNSEYADFCDCTCQVLALLRDNQFLEMPRRQEDIENDNEEVYALPHQGNPYAG